MFLPEPQAVAATLPEAIVYLAAADAEDPAVDLLLVRIGRLARRDLLRCDAVSVTYAGDDGFTTLEADPQLVRAVDEAQYADGDGPCLRAVREGHPSGGAIDTSIDWPGFRLESLRLGLHGVLAVPMFAANQPIASLNLWSRSPDALEPLRDVLVVLFNAPVASDWVAPTALDPGERQLARGLRRALELRAIINRAVGYLAARHQVRLDEAFQLLRSDSRSSGTDIARTAGRLLLS